MKLLRVIGAAAIGVTMLAAHALAADAGAVRTMMEKSGLVAQYENLGSQIHDAILKSPPPNMSPGLVSLMATIVGHTMDGKKLLAEVQSELVPVLSADDVKAMDAFFDSALGARIVKAETAGSTPAVQDEIDANAKALVAEARKNPRRMAVFDRIAKMLNTAELSAHSSESLMRAMAVAMAESGPMAPDPSRLAKVNARIDAMHGALVKQAHTMMLATAERVYRGFSTAEMETYANFLKTTPSQAMYAAVSAVMDRFYTETGKRIGEELVAAFRQQKT